MLSTNKVVYIPISNNLQFETIPVGELRQGNRILDYCNNERKIQNLIKNNYTGDVFGFSLNGLYVIESLNTSFQFYLVGVLPKILPINDKFMVTFYTYESKCFFKNKISCSSYEEAEKTLQKYKYLTDNQVIICTLYDVYKLRDGNDDEKEIFNYKLRVPKYDFHVNKYIPHHNKLNISITLLQNPTFVKT